MTERSVLFLCTGNSARSIMAEAMLSHLGRGRFRAHSAGSHPSGKVNPHALETLRELGMPAEGLRSKAWDEFAAPGASPIDFVITVCDNAAGEACPVWPGKPVTAHWGVFDPAAVEGSDDEKRRAFRAAAAILKRRIEALLALPLERLDLSALKGKLREIGQS
jgi:arsenate reductase